MSVPAARSERIETCQAVRLHDGTVGEPRLRLVEGPLHPETSWGDVLVRVHHSGINYKDALAASGRGKVARRMPLTPGIDAAGEVIESSDPRFARGDRVVATGHGLGERHDGGWSQLLRVPGAWLDPLDARMSTREAMGLGTAGVTAALAVDKLQGAGVSPDAGPVVVTGASGASGLHAVAMLAGLGYEVVALTGSPSSADRLRALGAADVRGRPEVDRTRDLGSAQWAGGIDCVGGDPLAWLLSTTRAQGTVVAFGNTAGNTLTTSVLPFILRGISLLGVDASDLPSGVREHLWRRLATDLRPGSWEEMLSVHPLADAPDLVDALLTGRSIGRVVLEVDCESP